MPEQHHFVFSKYNGTGNDFIIADNREGNYRFGHEQIRQLCDRHFGIGADGLIFIENSKKADFNMRYYNADGHEGSMCGNGGRCAFAYASSLGIVGKTASFEAWDGLHQAEIIETNTHTSVVTLSLRSVTSWTETDNRLLVDTGSPHLVVKADHLEELDVEKLGRELRYDESISHKGVNVNFIAFEGGTLSVRTYERGVECETLSCGTGVTASAIAASLWGDGEDFLVQTRGGSLRVQFSRQADGFYDIRLTGAAELVFEGRKRLVFL